MNKYRTRAVSLYGGGREIWCAVFKIINFENYMEKACKNYFLFNDLSHHFYGWLTHPTSHSHICVILWCDSIPVRVALNLNVFCIHRHTLAGYAHVSFYHLSTVKYVKTNQSIRVGLVIILNSKLYTIILLHIYNIYYIYYIIQLMYTFE